MNWNECLHVYIFTFHVNSDEMDSTLLLTFYYNPKEYFHDKIWISEAKSVIL